MNTCPEHSQVITGIARTEQKIDTLSADMARLDKRINGSFDRIAKHVDEGEKAGGFRERLTKLEMLVATAAQEKLNSTKASQYRIGLICGAPGIVWIVIQIVSFIGKVLR